MKNHFEYIVPSTEFYNAIGGISHYPVSKVSEYIDIESSLDVKESLNHINIIDLRNNEANFNSRP